MNPMTYYILALVLWFAFGLIIALFFFDSIKKWIINFNARYAERYAYYFRGDLKQSNAPRFRKILAWIEGSSYFVGALLFMNPVFGIWTVGFSFFAIAYFAKLLHSRELTRFDNQMVDITYAMKNALKAGLTLQGAMQLIAAEFQPPASEQFTIALREIQLGGTVEQALTHLEQRMPNPEMRILVNAVEILRQTGGNMIETFENVTETLKNRKRVEGKIKTLTAQGRMGAIILCAMPFVMALMLYFLNREYIAPLFNTLLGNIILTIALLLVATGWWIIQKITTIEV
jgi:tight adherence protein B